MRACESVRAFPAGDAARPVRPGARSRSKAPLHPADDPAQVLGYEDKHSLLVGVTTIQADIPHDSACELHPGDHPFIRHRSCVFYAQARIEASQKLIYGVKRGVFSPQGMLAEDIFARVCHGLTQSPSSTPKVLAFYQAVAKAAREKQ